MQDSEKETVQYLKELGVDGIVYDRIDMNKESKESIFSLDHRLQMEEGDNDESEERLSTCSCSTKSSGSESPKSQIAAAASNAGQVRSPSGSSPTTTMAEERHFKMISGTTV